MHSYENHNNNNNNNNDWKFDMTAIFSPSTETMPTSHNDTLVCSSTPLEQLQSPQTVQNVEDCKSKEPTTTKMSTTNATTANNASTTTATAGLKVLFLSSDTGGGHRASAESLAKQFELLYPGSTYELLDLATEHYPPPYSKIVANYKHLSKNPRQWKVLYGVTNSRFMERPMAGSIKFVSLLSERAIRKKIKSIQPDVVVSVHPLQTSVPILSCAKISHETGKHLPIFTVVTDLGSGHSTWFANGMETMFVGTKQIYELAKKRGNVPDEKLVLSGLPIRHDFAVQAEQMGDRTSPSGKDYQLQIRRQLELPATNRKTLLVMGGGEGVGSLSNIVDSLYYELVRQNINAIILVVCGRNEILQQSLKERNWNRVVQQKSLFQWKKKGNKSKRPSRLFNPIHNCGDRMDISTESIEAGSMTKSLRKVLSSGNFTIQNASTPLFVPSPASHTEEEEKTENVRPGLLMKSISLGAIEYGTNSFQNATSETKEGEAEESMEQAVIPVVEDETSKTTTVRPRLHMKSMSLGAIEYGTNSFQHATSETKEGEAEESMEQAVIPVVEDETLQEEDTSKTSTLGKVDVVGLGFVTNMAEYMVAADILISKAGPGTISEAAALSLPVMLTSYLPGQEEGNVDHVIDGNFGDYCDDSDPSTVAEEIADWLLDEDKLKKMSVAAKNTGAPHAARDIVRQIGDSTLKWRELNEAAGERRYLPTPR
jgi:UDP-N-acetylglucosamine:LPS N-acetylglucosamine transferase